MTFQWYLVTVILYTECIVITLLLLPFIKPYRWQQIFRSRLVSWIASRSTTYFNILMAVLAVLLADSLREIHKYSNMKPSAVLGGFDEHKNMHLFRAQRNFNLVGFTLFLWIVLRRLVSLVNAQAKLQADSDAALKQAASATEAAKKLMVSQKESSLSGAGDDKRSQEDSEKKVNKMKMELSDVRKELSSLKKELEIVNEEKSVLAKSKTGDEYAELMGEHEALRRRVKELESNE